MIYTQGSKENKYAILKSKVFADTQLFRASDRCISMYIIDFS